MTIVNDSVQKSNCKACSYWFFFSLCFSLSFRCFYFLSSSTSLVFFYSLSRTTTATETTVIVFYERSELVCILIFIFIYHLPKRKSDRLTIDHYGMNKWPNTDLKAKTTGCLFQMNRYSD